MLGNLCPRRPERQAGRGESRRMPRGASFGTAACIGRPRFRNRSRTPSWTIPSSVALSGQLAREQQMDVLANNIANLSTAGFKGEKMVFAEYLTSRPSGDRAAYVQDAGTVRDWSQGPLTQTGNPLDVALQGAGFLEVQTRDRHALHPRRPPQARRAGPARDARTAIRPGRRRHSRSSVPPGTAPITIGKDGTDHDRQAAPSDKLAVVNFDNLQAARRRDADGLYTTDRGADAGHRHQGRAGHGRGIERAAGARDDAADGRLARGRHAPRTSRTTRPIAHKNAIDRLAKTV